MVRFEERGIIDGWDIRSIYEPLTQNDLLEAEAFFMAFARVHNIDGHEVMSIFTKAKTQPGSHDGVLTQNSILVVSDRDMQGMQVNDSLRIDGNLYVITGISRPSGDIVRIEIEGNTTR